MWINPSWGSKPQARAFVLGQAESIRSAGTAWPSPVIPGLRFTCLYSRDNTNRWDNSARAALIPESSPNPCGSRCRGVVTEPSHQGRWEAGVGEGSGGDPPFPLHGETEAHTGMMPAEAPLTFLQLRCMSPRVMPGARCGEKMEPWQAGRAHGVQTPLWMHWHGETQHRTPPFWRALNKKPRARDGGLHLGRHSGLLFFML